MERISGTHWTGWSGTALRCMGTEKYSLSLSETVSELLAIRDNIITVGSK
jgi:hypothetical protein